MATSKKILRILITAPDARTMSALLQEHQPDVSCGGGPKRLENGAISVEAYVPESNVARLKKSGVKVEVLDDATATGRARQKEVGKGNRFEGENRIPRGLARKTKGGGNVIS